MAYVSLAARAAVGLVFAVALVSKVRSRAQRAEFVAATRRLAPGWLSPLVPAVLLAAVAAAIEAAVVVLLAVPATGGWGFALAAGLAASFGVAIGVALRRGETGACNCFGASARPLGATQLVRNALLFAIAALGLAGTLSGGAADPGGALVALVAGGVLAVLLVAADDIAFLFRPAPAAR